MRDRTAELLSIAERMRNGQGGASSSLSNPAAARGFNGLAPRGGAGANAGGLAANRSEFAKRAARIGQTIHTTSHKLARLAQLAKRTSMFDDPAREIGDLTAVIKQDITGLNAAIGELQSFSAGQQAERNKQSSAHSSTVVDNLRARLKDTTKEFKDVLTLRTENLKHNQNRRKMFSASTASDTAPLLPRRGPLSQGPGARGPLGAGAGPGQSQAAPSNQYVMGADGTNGEGSTMGAPGGIGASMQQQLLGPVEDSYMTHRAEALHNVESTIVELGGIFEQLAHMVAEQGEMAVRIDENVDETVTNVESAQAQLQKYMRTISSNRWLIMKVFSILMVFAVLFILFVA